jgi:hypothetical protein
MTTHSLTGKNEICLINLNGKLILNQKQNIPTKIKKLKDRILEDFLLPLFTKQWKKLNENIYFIESIQKSINNYYSIYQLDELVVYIELLKVIKILIETYQIHENYENTLTNNLIANEVVSMIFKTTKIQLLPEYEIYDSIIGKPSRDLNQKYNSHIISIINALLKQENMTYCKIKEYVEQVMTLHFEN